MAKTAVLLTRDLTEAEDRLIQLVRAVGEGRVELRGPDEWEPGTTVCGIDITVKHGQPLRVVRVLRFDQVGRET